MGNTRNSHLWYYAICFAWCTYNMHGISRFNGILYSGRRRNYQTSSIPSRLAPMSFYLKKKKKTMPSPYRMWIIGNNSMALRVRYEQTIIVFPNTRFCIEIVVWNKGYFRFDFIYVSGVHFQRHKPFFFHTRSLLLIFMLRKKECENEKKKDHFSLFDHIKKKLWDC